MNELSPLFSKDAPNGRIGGPEASTLWSQRLSVVVVLLVGFVARFFQARSYFLNPDEALHNLLASYSSFSLTYQATLTTAHPPLLIVMLHYWRWLGQSEVMLRLPSLLAGTACCWLTYLWLRRIADHSTAFLGLLLMTFSPAVMEVSAEVRQYALLMLFMAACLYFSERALQDESVLYMALFSLSLYGALLSHYSSLLFAFAVGVYMLARLFPWKQNKRLFAAWAVGQLLAVAMVGYFLVAHVARLKREGLPQEIAGTWLRKSLYHPGESSLLLFPLRQTVRVFTYLFSHGLLGSLVLLAFLAGTVWLLTHQPQSRKRASPRQLAILVGLPFVVNCMVAIAGLYPYGGTRHNVYLAFFAITGAAVGLALWKPKRTAWRTFVVLLGLAVCNLFPAPPPLIRARNHKRALMTDAIAFLQSSAPPGSVLLADYQSGLLLGYYACGHSVVQVFPPFEPFAEANCGRYTALTAAPQLWGFKSSGLAGQFTSAVSRFGIAQGTNVWLFDAGFTIDPAQSLTQELARLGCAEPRHFGDNILVCRLNIGNGKDR